MLMAALIELHFEKKTGKGQSNDILVHVEIDRYEKNRSFFFLVFSFRIFCEQRHFSFSIVKKEDINSSSAVFYQDPKTVLYCGVNCFNDNFCVGFGFNTNSQHCFGLHDFEWDGYSYQPVQSTSDKIVWYRSGKKVLYHVKRSYTVPAT